MTALLEIRINKVSINQASKDLNGFFKWDPRTIALEHYLIQKLLHHSQEQSALPHLTGEKRKKNSFSSCPIQVGHCCFSLCEVFLPEICQVLLWSTANFKCWMWLWPKESENLTSVGLGGREKDRCCDLGQLWEMISVYQILFIGVRAFSMILFNILN